MLAGLALAACSEAGPPPAKPPVRVRAIEARASNYAPVFTLTGVIAARTETNLAFRVGGRVSEKLVDVGAHVRPDTVMARIAPQEQQSDLRAAQAGVDAAQAQLKQAAATFERQQQLLARGFTTRASYDQAQQALGVAQGSLAAAESQLQSARDTLSYTDLRAGVSGIVTAANVEAGQVVQAAQTIFTVAFDGDRDAVFNVDEALLTSLPSPPSVQISLLSNPRITAPGFGRELSPVVDQRTGTIRAKVGIPNTPREMTLGAAVAGTAKGQARPAILLPWSALFSDRGQPAVWTIAPASKAVSLARIDVLAYESGFVVVAKGLEAGQEVVTAGVQLLRPGLVVEVAKGTGE